MKTLSDEKQHQDTEFKKETDLISIGRLPHDGRCCHGFLNPPLW